MLFDLNSFITLFLISKFENFRDSYSLSKVLAWKFGIVTGLDITRDLEFEGLISKVTNQGISKYSLTNKGEEFVENYMDKGKALMLETYPEENSFVTLIFK